MRGHKLKTWPKPFRAVKGDYKTCEIRRRDRDYRVGDYLMLCEFDPQKDVMSGEYLLRRITHIAGDDMVPRGLIEGFCVLSITELDSWETKQILGSGGTIFSDKIEWLSPGVRP